jgi:hypothetical protein
MVLLLALIVPASVFAQETDTTKQEIERETRERSLDLQRQLDRSMSGGMMTEMGTYSVPDDKQFYKPPFMGQKYLDQAVEAYRKEIRNKIGNGWYWDVLRAISPFINNKFEFGVYGIYDWDPIDRDNPLQKSYNNSEKRQ